jgi:hypothetical protein
MERALMRCLSDSLVALGVALLVSSSTFVLGQVQKSAAPDPRPNPQEKSSDGKTDGQVKDVEFPKKAKAERQAPRQQVAVKAAVVKAAVQVRAVQAVPANVIEAQAEQFIQQFRPMVRGEYYFIRHVCELSKEQRIETARVAERSVRTAAMAFVEAQQKMNRGGWRPGMKQPDPRVIIEEELAKSLVDILTPKQQAVYQQELQKRAASRKKLVIDNLVAKLDQDLVLTPDQRDKITYSLAKHWDDAWGQSLDMLMNLESFFPNLPDPLIVPLLTERQKDVWLRVPRNSNVFWGVSFGGMIVDNDPLDDPELVQARKEIEAEGKKRKDAEDAAKKAGNEAAQVEKPKK